ncbi:MAG: alpha/beta hydrolase [Pararobbsia sp.]
MKSSASDKDRLVQDREDAATRGVANENDDVVRIFSHFDLDGIPYARAVLTPNSDRRRKEIHCDPRPPIPVIFIPGVMGSLLAKTGNGRKVWYPPNMDSVTSAIPGAISIIAGWFDSAADRASRFDPASATVDPRGPVELGNSGLSEAEALRRGWGTVHRWSYHPVLAWLEYTLNHPMLDGELQGEWAHGDAEGEHAALQAVLGTHPSDYGGHGPGAPITADSDVFKALIRYRYPVYAIGYNFLQSNQVSGQQVLDGIDFKVPHTKQITRIMGIREICRENRTDKAIIITHSMGGLVARMASQLCGGAQDMLGVIHGAQPATGAPLFAKRFRTGGEGKSFIESLVNQSLLGRDDAEFVAIVSNAEGPMELAPMPDYHDGEPWWIVVDKQGEECLRLPQKSALEELYVNDAWYGLLPDSSLLDPAGIVKERLDKERYPFGVHQYFKDTMRAVVKRQRNLHNNYHPNTFALYGNGELTRKRSDASQTPAKLEVGLPNEELQTWGNVVWRGDLPEGVTEAELKAAKLIDDDHQGVLTILVRGQAVKLTVQQQAVAPKQNEKNNGIIHGDATVPAWSAAAQGRGLIPGLSKETANGVQMVFVQGGYEHQFCFDHPWTRWATLYSVARIAHSAVVSAA